MKKSIFLFFAAILCAIGVNAKVIYLKPNSNWTQSNAAFWVHAWGGTGNIDLKMTPVANDPTIYEAEVGTSTSVIFLRRDPGKDGSNVWDCWNRMGNLAIPADKNCCTINNGEWTQDKDNATSHVTWSTYTPSTTAPDRYLTGTLAGGWNANDVKMTYDEATETYSHTFTAVAAGELHQFKVTDGTWSKSWGGDAVSPAIEGVTIGSDGNVAFTLSVGGDVTITFKDSKIQLTTTGSFTPVETFDYYVVGNFNGWNTADAAYGMTKDGDVYKKEVTFAAAVEFKVCNGSWAKSWGANNLGDNKYKELEGTDNLKMKEKKTFTIIFNPAQNLITFEGLTAEAVVKYDYYIAGTENLTGYNWKENGLGMTKEGDVYKHTFTELNAGTYEFKITDGQWNSEGDATHEHTTLGAAYKEVSYNEGNIKIVTEEAINLTVIFNAATDKITFEGLTQIYTVKVTAENGTIKGLAAEGKYEHGATATLTATPAAGYHFVNWTKGEVVVSTENPYKFTVTADVALVANFVAVDYKDITFTVGKSGFTGVPQIKWWGAKGLEDAAEPVEMTAGQYSRYSYTFSNIDAITGVSFYIVLDGVQSKTITLHETPNTYSQFNTILQEVFVTLDGETEGVQLEGHPKAGYSSDYTKVNGVVQLPANTTKAFKLTVDGKDKGGNTIALTKDNLTANFTEDGEGNATIATELAGGYLFTYDYITKDVTVVYPFVGTMDLGQMTPSYSDESVKLEDDNYNEVTIYNVVEGEHTYGENFDIEASVKHNGEWYTLTGKGSWTLADGVMTLVTTNLVDENKTVNYTITATALAPQEYTIACNGTYDEEVSEHYSSIKYAATTDEEDVIVIEIGVYGEETSASGQFNDNWFTTLTYTVAEGEDGVKVLTATATDEAGNTYHITITATKAVYPEINIYNATVVSMEEGSLVLSASYEGKDVSFELFQNWEGELNAMLEIGVWEEEGYMSCMSAAPALEEEDGNYTVTGIFTDDLENKYIITITTKANPATALDNLNTTVAPVKAIVNGQLIIIKNGVQYNAQGAILK